MSDSVANPCGLIAKSLFNDTYTIQKAGTQTNITIVEKGITWPNDKGKKFVTGNKNTQWIDP